MMALTRCLAVAAIIVNAALIACSRSPDESAKKDSAAADPMAGMDMPGMEMKKKPAGLPMTVSLTSAQIEKGRVRWDTVSTGTSAGIATVPGEVIANEDATARLGAPVRGRVITVSVRAGDAVAPGEALVTIESPEAGMAQAEVERADAEVTSMRAELQFATAARGRAERLLALKAISRQDYERALADEERARSSLAQAEADAKRARATATQLGATGRTSGEVVLQSPFAGVVLERSAVPGTVVEAGAPLVVVTNPTSLWLTIAAPEHFAGLFRRGGVVRFTVPAFPGETFTARIDAMGAGLDPATRTLNVRGTVQQAGRLKAQMLATVTVLGVGTVNAAFVPDDAVQMLEGKTYVFIATPESTGATFERREVEVGSRSGGRAAILKGLSAGDVVVTTGAFAVKSTFLKATMSKMEM
jgi:cobalt-zinc-cadmium efflux system membrane fusion protein